MGRRCTVVTYDWDDDAVEVTLYTHSQAVHGFRTSHHLRGLLAIIVDLRVKGALRQPSLSDQRGLGLHLHVTLILPLLDPCSEWDVVLFPGAI